MAILIVGHTINKEFIAICELLNKVVRPSGKGSADLTAQLIKFNKQNKVFANNDFLPIDIFSFQPEGVFLEILPESRVHVHDFQVYIEQHPFIFANNFPAAGSDQSSLTLFNKVFYCTGYDPRGELIRDALKKEVDPKKYIKTKYIDYILSWVNSTLGPIEGFENEQIYCGGFMDSIFRDPDSAIRKLFHFFEVSVENSGYRTLSGEFVQLFSTEKMSVDWRHYFSVSQKITSWFIFGKALLLFDRNGYQRYRKSFSKLDCGKMQGILKSINKRLKFYYTFSNLRIIQILLGNK